MNLPYERGSLVSLPCQPTTLINLLRIDRSSNHTVQDLDAFTFKVLLGDEGGDAWHLQVVLALLGKGESKKGVPISVDQPLRSRWEWWDDTKGFWGNSASINQMNRLDSTLEVLLWLPGAGGYVKDSNILLSQGGDRITYWEIPLQIRFNTVHHSL